MATYTLKEIVQLFKDGKSLDGIVAIEAYEASVSAGKLRGAKKKSEARSRAARENGKKGGRPKRTEEVPLAEENRSGSVGVVTIDEFCGAPDGSFQKYIQDQRAEEARYTKPALKLPPGVMKGSDLEGRGHE